MIKDFVWNKIRILRKKNNKYKDYEFRSRDYWDKRYRNGGTSGEGSYNHLAEFKAEIINEFLEKNDINSAIEFGCGDGNQLRYISYKNYIGFDVSPKAINICRKKFASDKSKQFKLLEEYSGEKAELTLSLDVIFHLIEDEIFEEHMSILFNSSTKFVIIYSSNKDKQEEKQATHVKHRNFTKWVDINIEDWELVKVIPNLFSETKNNLASSFSDFYFYKRNLV